MMLNSRLFCKPAKHWIGWRS